MQSEPTGRESRFVEIEDAIRRARERTVLETVLTPDRGYLHRTLTWWKDSKDLYPWLAPTGFALMSVLSIGSVHTAGFLFRLPHDALSLAILPFADNLVVTASLYLVLSYSVARIAVYAFFPIAFLFLQVIIDISERVGPRPSLLLRLIRRLARADNRLGASVALIASLIETIWIDWVSKSLSPFGNPRRRRGRRRGSERSEEELLGTLRFVTYVALTCLSTLAIFCAVYFAWRVETLWEDPWSNTSLLILALIVLMLSYDFLRPKVRPGTKRTLTLTLGPGILAGALLWAAFQAGSARFDHLATLERVVIQDGRLAGRYRILLRSGEDKLLLDDLSQPSRLVVSSGHEVLTYTYGDMPLGQPITYPGNPLYRETGTVDHRNSVRSIQTESGRGRDSFVQEPR